MTNTIIGYILPHMDKEKRSGKYTPEIESPVCTNISRVMLLKKLGEIYAGEDIPDEVKDAVDCLTPQVEIPEPPSEQ